MSAGAIRFHLQSCHARLHLRRAPERVALAALICALLFAGPKVAAADAAAELFQAGRIAFELSDFEGALQAYEAAAKANLGGPVVHFNIGVTAYRLGRYDRAERAFREVARTPAMAALAHYNLGLVAQRRGDFESAQRWFASAESAAVDEGLRALASAQLTAAPARPQQNWAGYGSIAAGYDDNVALVSGSDVLGVSGVDDSFAEAQFALSAPLGQPWRFDAGAVILDYHELHRFDQLNAQAGARYELTRGPWSNQIGLQLTYTLLDGEAFDNKRMLVLRTSRDLSADWRVRARYRFSDIDGMNEFEGAGGDRHEISTKLSWRREPWDVGVAYEFEQSDHENIVLSATRHQLVMDVRRELNNLWTLAFDAAVRNSRFDADAGDEDRFDLGFEVSRLLASHWRLIIRYAHADNDADRAQFNYERSRIGAMIEVIL